MASKSDDRAQVGVKVKLTKEVPIHIHCHCPDCRGVMGACCGVGSYGGSLVPSPGRGYYGGSSNRRWGCCIFFTVLFSVIIVTSILVPVLAATNVFDDASDSGGGSDSNDVTSSDTTYSVNETRLFKVASIFKEQVGILASDHYNANATLYVMSQPPPLTTKHSLSDSTSIIYSTSPLVPDDEFFYWHYYLHQNSNVTLRGCVTRDCDPYHIYIVKGPQNFFNWRKSEDVRNTGEKSAFITKVCSELTQSMDYTIKEDDHYYFFYYFSGTCSGDFIDQEHAGSVSIYIDKFEYSTSEVQFDDMCNTYEFSSCNVNVPLRSSEMVLITVQGQPDDKYTITFTSTTRKWLIAIIVIGSILVLACTVVTICCICCKRIKKRRKRQYAHIQ